MKDHHASSVSFFRNRLSHRVRAVAEGLVEAVQASGGRVLTRARTASVLVEHGRAVGVSVAREPLPADPASSSNAKPSGSRPGAGGAGKVEIRVAPGGGSVISSIGVIDTFRHLVPHPKDAKDAKDADKTAVATCADGGGVPVAGEGALKGKKKGSTAAVSAASKETGYEPAGFQTLIAARPRVHLCVGLRGNWLEDLDGTSAYFHHVWMACMRGGCRGVVSIGVSSTVGCTLLRRLACVVLMSCCVLASV